MNSAPRRRLSAALVAAALLTAAPADADSIRCDSGPGYSGGIVSNGDTTLDLVGKCGWPALREDEAETRSRLEVVAGTTRSAVTTIQRWTYNRGPNQFIQVVLLEGGQVTRIERGSYGYDLGPAPAGPAIPRARCGQLAIHEGDTTLDLLARCGPPATRDERVETFTIELLGANGPVLESRTRVVEVWRYDFGPRILTRHATVADGRVRKVETGSYGYSR
jgi:hypothetical protein